MVILSRLTVRVLAAVGVAALVALAHPEGPAAGQVDWCEETQQWADDFNERGDIGMEYYADDVVFTGGPVCNPDECIGKDAYRNYFEYLVALETQLTITSCEVSGDTIAVTYEMRGRHQREAGVERIIVSVLSVFEGDTLVSERGGVDIEDSQTAEWLRWWSGTPRPTFTMGPGRDADQSPGVAVMERYPDFSAVSVRIEPGPTGVPQPINIHEGICADLGPVVFTLTDIADGVSHTVLEGVPASDLQTGNLAIAVQKSEDEPDVFVACGDIPALEAEEQPAPDAAPVAGTGGFLGDEGGGLTTWWWALGAAGVLLVMGGLVGLYLARRRR